MLELVSPETGGCRPPSKPAHPAAPHTLRQRFVDPQENLKTFFTSE
jgi:hypothetical protein